MLRNFFKTIFYGLVLIVVGILLWTIIMLNPSWHYDHETNYGIVTVYHNEPLDKEAERVIGDAVRIIKDAQIFDKDISIQLCMNDDQRFINLHPLMKWALGYSYNDITVLKNGTVRFADNLIEARWDINNDELRRFDLTWLIAHEFTHNLQYNRNAGYIFRSTLSGINWKLEGHAEYVARQFRDDGLLSSKVKNYLVKEKEKHQGLPVFDLEDGTKQILSYYKYALVVQYLFEEKGMDYDTLCATEIDLESVYSDMVELVK